MFCNSNLPETRDGRLIQANPWGPWAPVATLPMPNAPMGASYTTWRDTSQETISLTFGHGDSIILNEALEYVCPPPLSHDYNYLAEKFSCKIVSGGSKTDGKMGKFHGVIEFT